LPRLDKKPWGGRRLEKWGITVPPGEQIGEALLTAPESRVVSGPYAGSSLADLSRLAPDAWIGSFGFAATGGRPVFPLLAKLIDGQDDLSIQVHPDDNAAAAAGLGTGKTEAWCVLEARPGSFLYLGLRPGTEADAFADACRRGNGSAADLLRRVPAEPGVTVLIPAGTPHALGAGVVVYEIQQPSNVTFRLDDWGRVDALGVSRPLHHAEGMSVLDPASRPAPIPPVPISSGTPRRALLVATRYFALERIAFSANNAIGLPVVDSPQVLTCLARGAKLSALGCDCSLSVGETAVIPAGLRAALAGFERSLLLRAWVPDFDVDVSTDAGGINGLDSGVPNTPWDS
jgi:mannose-6-phosphate isomerase